MAGDKVEMPEVLVSKSSDGSFTAKHEKGILEFPDDSKDQAVSENTIPLSPQWLYAKPSEVRVGSSAVPMDARVPNVSLHRSSADFVQKDRWRQDGSQDKKDWRRFIPDVESSQRWREEERETGLLGRKDHRKEGEMEYRKNDRRLDNTSVGEITDTKNLAQSERRNDVVGRSCLAEGRRDSKWSSRWGPDDKEDPRAEKKSDIDKEYCNNEKHSLVASSRVLAEPESHEKWRPRHRQEVQSGGSTVYRAAPGFGLERGRVDGPSIRFAPGRGRSKLVGTSLGASSSLTNPIGALSEIKPECMVGKSGLRPYSFRYPRGKLLDIYRHHDALLPFNVFPDALEEASQITTNKLLVPLAFVSPDVQDESILDDIWKGNIIGSESAHYLSRERTLSTTDVEGENIPSMLSMTDKVISDSGMKSEGADAITKKLMDHLPELKSITGVQGNESASSSAQIDSDLPSVVSDVVGSDAWLNSHLANTHSLPPLNSCAEPSDKFASLYEDPFFQNIANVNEHQQKSNSDLKIFEQGTALEELTLFYQDPQGEIQGPFLGADIISWFEQGFFGIDLPVCLSDAPVGSPFQQLGEIMPNLKLNTQSAPVMNPIAASEPSILGISNSDITLSEDFVRSASRNSSVYLPSDYDDSLVQLDHSKMPKPGDSVSHAHHYDDLLQSGSESLPFKAQTKKQSFQDFVSSDTEEVLYSGKPSIKRNGSTGNSNSNHHFVSGEVGQASLSNQKMAADNGLHPLGLLWSELEGAHSKHPLSSNVVDHEHFTHPAVGRDSLLLNRQHSLYGGPLSESMMNDSWSSNQRSMQPNPINAHHLSRIEQDSNKFNFEEQLLMQQHLQRQYAKQKSLQTMHLNDSFLGQLQVAQQHQSVNPHVSDIEEQFLEKKRQMQIQQQLKQQQQFHQFQLLQQQQKQPQAQQLILEQLLHQQDHNFGLPHGNIFPGNNGHDELLRQHLLHEAQQQSRNQVRRHDPNFEQQFFQGKLGHMYQHEQNNDLLEVLSHPKHRQMRLLEQHLGIQQEQILPRHLSSASRQSPVLEDEGTDRIWSIDESGQFVRPATGPLQSRSSELDHLELLQQQHGRPSFERKSLVDRNFTFPEKLQYSMYGSTNSQPLGSPGVNSFRLQGLERPEQRGHIHSSGEGVQFPSVLHSQNHQIPGQFTPLEDQWSVSNGNLTNNFINQLHIDSERQDFTMNTSRHENPNLYVAAASHKESSEKFRAHPLQSVDLISPSHFSSYEMNESNRHLSSLKSDNLFNLQGNPMNIRDSDTGKQMPQRLINLVMDEKRNGRLPEDEQFFQNPNIEGRPLYSDSNMTGDSSIDSLNLLENKGRKHGSKERLSLESVHDQFGSYSADHGELRVSAPSKHSSRSSTGDSISYNFDMTSNNLYNNDIQKERISTISSQGPEISLLRRSTSQIATSKGNLSSNQPSKDNNTWQGGNSQLQEIPISTKKDMRFHRTSSGSDPDAAATETSFVDMLKSTKKTGPEVDQGNASNLDSAESTSQVGKSGKKKGKKGKHIDPSLLGFKVSSNRPLMGEIQRLDY